MLFWKLNKERQLRGLSLGVNDVKTSIKSVKSPLFVATLEEKGKDLASVTTKAYRFSRASHERMESPETYFLGNGRIFLRLQLNELKRPPVYHPHILFFEIFLKFVEIQFRGGIVTVACTIQPPFLPSALECRIYENR